MEILQLVRAINEDLLQRLENQPKLKYIFDDLDEISSNSKWFGYPPADINSIEEKEAHLGISLPKSYKDFLLISNGFRNISPFLYNLYPIEKIDWAKNIEDPWWLDLLESDPIEMSDKDYLIYGEEQQATLFRPEYFRNSLKISDWGDSCCLYLNPAIIEHGEWEVLFYGTWFIGAERFQSFGDFLDHTHKLNQELLQDG